jgi:hypothetical protein
VVIFWLFNNAVPTMEILKARMRFEYELEVHTGEDIEECGFG